MKKRRTLDIDACPSDAPPLFEVFIYKDKARVAKWYTRKIVLNKVKK